MDLGKLDLGFLEPRGIIGGGSPGAMAFLERSHNALDMSADNPKPILSKVGN